MRTSFAWRNTNYALPNGDSMDINRRRFVGLAGSAGVLMAATNSIAHAAGEPQNAHPHAEAAQPQPQITDQENTSDILVETLITWGATHVFGIVGDGINPIIEALRQRRDRITFVTTRHEESAAFMASAFAKQTGGIGVCIATTGPGAVHLMNGLYDAAYDNAPVVAITGSTFRDLEGLRFMQGLNTVRLMESVAVFNEQINGPDHAILLVNQAIRAAKSERGVAHLTLPKDVQPMKRSADRPSTENHGGRTSSAWLPPAGVPPMDQLHAAAEILNSGRRVAILAGAGCFGSELEVRKVAELLAAPIAKAYLAKALLPDNDLLTTGGIGHLGTVPSMQAMHECDTVLILGSMMPWIDYYPRPGQARGVQIDIKPTHIGLKYPVDVGLTGDMKSTLSALLPLLSRKQDRDFLTTSQERMNTWNAFLKRDAVTPNGEKIKPQTVCRMLSELAPSNVVYSMDAGSNTHFAARMIDIREGQRWSGTGTLVSMASGLPYGVAAAFAFPDRPSIVVAGDGGFAMLMAELSTAVLYKRNLKVLILNNDAFG